MFQRRARKATATDRPVKMSGVARLSVSRSANFEPNAPLMISPSTENGLAPAAMARSEAITTVEPMAMAGGTVVRKNEGLATGSRRMGRLRFVEALPRHPDAQFGGCHAAAHETGRQAAFGHDVDHIRQGHDLVEILGDQEHRSPTVARGQKLRMHVVHSTDIQTA